jgi:hypothetical protein
MEDRQASRRAQSLTCFRAGLQAGTILEGGYGTGNRVGSSRGLPQAPKNKPPPIPGGSSKSLSSIVAGGRE